MAETVGWLADKLSIIELKIYHMQEQAERRDATAEFRAQCERKLEVMREQRDDLAAEMTALIDDIAGHATRIRRTSLIDPDECLAVAWRPAET